MYSIHVSTDIDKEITCMGLWILNTGMRAGRIRLEYSYIVQSSAISNTIGKTKGIILWLRNSATSAGTTF